MLLFSLQYYSVGGPPFQVGASRGIIRHFRRIRGYSQHRLDTAERVRFYRDAPPSRCSTLLDETEEPQDARESNHGKIK